VKSCAIFLNGNLGLRVLDFVRAQSDLRLKVVVLNDARKRSEHFRAEVEGLIKGSSSPVKILEWSPQNLENVKQLLKNCDFGISVLFGNKISSEFLDSFKIGAINLHPSLLPYGRGADPVPWGIMLNQPQGATVHLLSEDLDRGDILSQEEIGIDLSMNAGEVYEKCVDSLYFQLTKILTPWLEGKLVGKDQKSQDFPTRKAAELDKLRKLRPDEILTAEAFLLRLQALTYSDGRYPVYEDHNGKKWEIRIELTPTC